MNKELEKIMTYLNINTQKIGHDQSEIWRRMMYLNQINLLMSLLNAAYSILDNKQTKKLLLGLGQNTNQTQFNVTRIFWQQASAALDLAEVMEKETEK